MEATERDKIHFALLSWPSNTVMSHITRFNLNRLIRKAIKMNMKPMRGQSYNQPNTEIRSCNPSGKTQNNLMKKCKSFTT
ncbi:hypothetical protein GDO78_013056 [Eleutherodactylus coqui]|uniref:Uncharacterized protein n=1 Tax=Eleutherodactylus coqui TaxID=57060 RepID=A0A8J6F044_ELECQ|nr:hypothetical protein GDO78_013056 [Eleutherodactylus coqui]